MTSRVVVSLRVPCSPIQAFEIFTEEIGNWWADSELFRFTPRSPGKLAFEPPSNTTHGRLVEQIGRYGETTGTDHMLLRVQWPGLGQKMAVRTLERLGRVVEQLRQR